MSGHTVDCICFDCVMAGQPTLRDQFAMAALAGLMAHPRLFGDTAETAYKIADCMLKAREIK